MSSSLRRQDSPGGSDDVSVSEELYATSWNRTRYALENDNSTQYWPEARHFFAKTTNDTTKGQYNHSEGAKGTASAPLTDEESQDGNGLHEFVEVGLLLSGADFQKYSSSHKGGTKQRGPGVIVPHDPQAIRVASIVTSHIEDQNKYYVCVDQQDGVCSTKIIGGKNVFFYPWCVTAGELSIKENQAAIGRAVRLEAATIKETRQKPRLLVGQTQAVEGLTIPFNTNYANLASIYWASYIETGDTSFLSNYSELIRESRPELTERFATGIDAVDRFFWLKENFMDDLVARDFVRQIKELYPQVGDLDVAMVQRVYRDMKANNRIGQVQRRMIPTFLKLLQRKSKSNTLSQARFADAVVECLEVAKIVEETIDPVMDHDDIAKYPAVLRAHYNEIVEHRGYLLRCSSSMRNAHGPSLCTTSIDDIIEKASQAVDVATLQMYVRQLLVLDVSGVCHNIHKAISHLDLIIEALGKLLKI